MEWLHLVWESAQEKAFPKKRHLSSALKEVFANQGGGGGGGEGKDSEHCRWRISSWQKGACQVQRTRRVRCEWRLRVRVVENQWSQTTQVLLRI